MAFYRSSQTLISFPPLLVVLAALLSLDPGQDGCSSQENQQDRHLTHLDNFSLPGEAEFHSNLCLLPLAWGMYCLFHFRSISFSRPVTFMLQKSGVKGEERVCRQGTVRRFIEKRCCVWVFNRGTEKNVKKESSLFCFQNFVRIHESEFYQLTNFCYLLLVAYVLFKRRGWAMTHLNLWMQYTG